MKIVLAEVRRITGSSSVKYVNSLNTYILFSVSNYAKVYIGTIKQVRVSPYQLVTLYN